MFKPVRRVITGHDSNGRSIIELDESSAPGRANIVATTSRRLTYLWKGPWGPAALAPPADTVQRDLSITPQKEGVVFRIIEFAPDGEAFTSGGATLFDAVPGEVIRASGARHPGMHKTNTIDFVIVLRGEVWLLMERGESLLKAGDCIVQRGTMHAWSNRSEAPCVCAIVMVDAS